MFDLEQQISYWRHELSQREGILADDIAELEDQLLSLVAQSKTSWSGGVKRVILHNRQSIGELMESNLTLGSIAALFGAMVVLASIPSVSVLAVSARSATAGFMHGVFTTIGIMVGDIIFIILAVGGLSILAETMGAFFVLVKYLGGAYLIWLGIGLWRSTPTDVEIEDLVEASRLSSFLTGLFITLGDLKAILFYLGFFPAFVDLTTISIIDISIITVTAVVTVGSIKLGYAFIADRSRVLFNRSGPKKIINRTAGSVMIGVGVFLVVKT